jgi:uncharacterized membrane protein YraQ (UPF0718 family)
MQVFDAIGQSLYAAFGMGWQVLWSLVLGFVISGMIQAYVSRAKMSQALGRAGFKEIALATGFGAASSSCSYAAIAAAKSMFKRGAHLIPALAFMFASTNLVIELGLILWQLMGWQFALAEWFGGLVLIALMVLLVRLTYPKRIVEEGRAHAETGNVAEHNHGDELAPGRTLWEKLRSRDGWVYVAHYVAMDWSMLWKDLIGGFLIAGFLAVVIPNAFWNSLFILHAPGPLRLIENAIVGPIVAVISFVCSVGNVPLAAILFSGGITFGGAIAFLYADLIVLPILDIYRKYYGWRLAAYITGILFATMVVAGIIVDLVFTGLDHLFPAAHFIATPNHHLIAMVEHLTFNYTAILNILAIGVIIWLVMMNRRHPMLMHGAMGDHGAMGAQDMHNPDLGAHTAHAQSAAMSPRHQVAHNRGGAQMERKWSWILGLAMAGEVLLLFGAVALRGLHQQAAMPMAVATVPNTVHVTETDYHIAASQTSFTPGVTYHFILTNASDDTHEFMLGPQMPMGMSMAQVDAQALTMQSNIAPHQTRRFDVTFPMGMSTSMMNGTTMTKLEMSCHLAGHYEAGMLLPITLTT